MSPPQEFRRFPWFGMVLAALGSGGVAAAWVAAAMLSSRSASKSPRPRASCHRETDSRSPHHEYPLEAIPA